MTPDEFDEPPEPMPAAPEPPPADPERPRRPCFWHSDRWTGVACTGCERPLCPECEDTVESVETNTPVPVCATCTPLFGVPSSVPWEDPGGFGGFFRTWGWTLARPKLLARAFPRTGLGRPIAFAYFALAPAVILASACIGIFTLLLSGFARGGNNEVAMFVIIAVSVVWGLYALVPLGIAVAALPTHLVVLMAGGEGGFHATYRLLCYSTCIWVTAYPVAGCLGAVGDAIIPGFQLLFWFATAAWSGFFLYHAGRRVHGLRLGGGVALAFTPAIVIFLGVAIPVALVVAATLM